MKSMYKCFTHVYMVIAVTLLMPFLSFANESAGGEEQQLGIKPSLLTTVEATLDWSSRSDALKFKKPNEICDDLRADARALMSSLCAQRGFNMWTNGRFLTGDCMKNDFTSATYIKFRATCTMNNRCE